MPMTTYGVTVRLRGIVKLTDRLKCDSNLTMSEDKPQTAEEYRNAELTSDVAGSNEPNGDIPEDPLAELEHWLEAKVEEMDPLPPAEEAELGELSRTTEDDTGNPAEEATDEEVRQAVLMKERESLETTQDYIEAYGLCETEGCQNGTPSKDTPTCGNCPSWAIKAQENDWDLRSYEGDEN